MMSGEVKKTFIRVSRSIDQTPLGFMELVRHHAEQVFYDDYSEAPYRPDRFAVFGRELGIKNGPEFQTAIGRRIFKLHSELGLRIFERSAYGSGAYKLYSSFAYKVANADIRKASPIQIQEKLDALYTALSIDEPTHITISCSDLLRNYTKSGLELSLSVDQDGIFVAENAIFESAFQYVARLKRASYRREEFTPNVPIITVAPNVSSESVDEFQRNIEDELALDGQFMVGALRRPLVG